MNKIIQLIITIAFFELLSVNSVYGQNKDYVRQVTIPDEKNMVVKIINYESGKRWLDYEKNKKKPPQNDKAIDTSYYLLVNGSWMPTVKKDNGDMVFDCDTLPFDPKDGNKALFSGKNEEIKMHLPIENVSLTCNRTIYKYDTINLPDELKDTVLNTLDSLFLIVNSEEDVPYCIVINDTLLVQDSLFRTNELFLMDSAFVSKLSISFLEDSVFVSKEKDIYRIQVIPFGHAPSYIKKIKVNFDEKREERYNFTPLPSLNFWEKNGHLVVLSLALLIAALIGVLLKRNENSIDGEQDSGKKEDNNSKEKHDQLDLEETSHKIDQLGFFDESEQEKDDKEDKIAEAREDERKKSEKEIASLKDDKKELSDKLEKERKEAKDKIAEVREDERKKSEKEIASINAAHDAIVAQLQQEQKVYTDRLAIVPFASQYAQDIYHLIDIVNEINVKASELANTDIDDPYLIFKAIGRFNMAIAKIDYEGFLIDVSLAAKDEMSFSDSGITNLKTVSKDQIFNSLRSYFLSTYLEKYINAAVVYNESLAGLDRLVPGLTSAQIAPFNTYRDKLKDCFKRLGIAVVSVKLFDKLGDNVDLKAKMVDYDDRLPSDSIIGIENCLVYPEGGRRPQEKIYVIAQK